MSSNTKRYIELDQIISKKGDSPEITESEMEKLIDGILDFVEESGYVISGSYGLKSDEEL